LFHSISKYSGIGLIAIFISIVSVPASAQINPIVDSLKCIDCDWPSIEMPTFPGGMDALCRFITKNLEYPKKAMEDNDTGRVRVMFVVSNRGSVQDVKVRKSSGFSLLDSAAVKVIKMMPKWVPGKRNGQPCAVGYTIPIVFELTDKGVSKKDQCKGWGK
jgi:TonB family protein